MRVIFFHYVSRKRRRRGEEIMQGKLFRRNKDGYIYEAIGQEDATGPSPRWILWNDRVGERQYVLEVELARQVGWELVGTSVNVRPQEDPDRVLPAALMK